MELGIYTPLMFDYFLQKDEQLFGAVSTMGHGLQLRTTKDLIFTCGDAKFKVVSYMEAIERARIASRPLPTTAQAVLMYLLTRSCVGDLKFTLQNIFDVLCMRKGKAQTLIFMGVPDAGKTLLADIFTSVYHNYEIGNINSPKDTKLPDFWLENIVHCSCRRTEELSILNKAQAEQFKNVFVSNQQMLCMRKFLHPRPCSVCPYVLTMNGTREADLAKYCSSDLDALLKRVYMVLMPQATPMEVSDYNLLVEYKQELCIALYDKYVYWCEQDEKNKQVFKAAEQQIYADAFATL